MASCCCLVVLVLRCVCRLVIALRLCLSRAASTLIWICRILLVIEEAVGGLRRGLGVRIGIGLARVGGNVSNNLVVLTSQALLLRCRVDNSLDPTVWRTSDPFPLALPVVRDRSNRTVPSRGLGLLYR